MENPFGFCDACFHASKVFSSKRSGSAGRKGDESLSDFYARVWHKSEEMAGRSQGPECKHEDMDSFLEENYRVTPECVFAYPKHPKHVFIQDGPYTEWRYFNCSELLRRIQDIGDKVYPGPEYYPDDYHENYAGRKIIYSRLVPRHEDLGPSV